MKNKDEMTATEVLEFTLEKVSAAPDIPKRVRELIDILGEDDESVRTVIEAWAEMKTKQMEAETLLVMHMIQLLKANLENGKPKSENALHTYGRTESKNKKDKDEMQGIVDTIKKERK